jgi:hypothetical protein
MFKDAEQALRWAFNTIERPILKTSAINHMRQERAARYSTPVIDGLPNQYRHAQAAQIIGMVEGLPDPAAVEYLKARFGMMVSHADLHVVVYRGCAALGVGLEKRAEVYKVMRGYFCHALTVRQIRHLLGCRTLHAIASRKCLYDTLDILDRRALAEMTDVLERHGLIESNYVT